MVVKIKRKKEELIMKIKGLILGSFLVMAGTSKADFDAVKVMHTGAKYTLKIIATAISLGVYVALNESPYFQGSFGWKGVGVDLSGSNKLNDLPSIFKMFQSAKIPDQVGLKTGTAVGALAGLSTFRQLNKVIDSIM
jgi:hypothetical protein